LRFFPSRKPPRQLDIPAGFDKGDWLLGGKVAGPNTGSWLRRNVQASGATSKPDRGCAIIV